MLIPFDDLLEERERRRCAPNWDTSTHEELLEAFTYFCATYWHIRHPSRGCIKFEMSQAQQDTVLAWLDNRYSIILKARQLGFSTLAGAFCVWATYFYGDRHIIMLSKTERDAIKLLDKSKYGFKKLPDWMLLTGPVWDTKLTRLSFSNESIIESLPSGNDPARGESVWLVILDEWAHLSNPDEAWAAIEPIADVGGRVIGLSTANGEGNVFFDIWSRSHGHGTGENRWHSIFHSWREDGAGTRDDAWYEQKKIDLPDWQLAQEYPDNPEEAFLRSGRPVFNIDALRSIESTAPRRGFLLASPVGLAFEEVDGGPLRLFEAPREHGVYVIGADVAEGLEHGDYSSAHVIDVRNQRLVAHWHGKIDPDLFGETVLYELGTWYRTALVGVESNNHGGMTLKALQRQQYRNLYMERAHNKRGAKPTDRYGFRTTQTSKPLIIGELGRMIREDTIAIPCSDTLHELRTFVREGDGKMHGSPFDDRTMSFAIGAWMMQYAFLPQYKQDDRPGPGTMGWFEAQMYADKRDKPRRIGAHSVRS